MRILDAAVGTQLAKHGFALRAPSYAIAANRQSPKLVSRIYQDYLDAGAQALTLNSFGLSGGLSLDRADLEEALRKRAQEALALAPAGVTPIWGALSLGAQAHPGPRLLAETEALLGVGVSLLRFETLCDLGPLIDLQTQFLSALRHHQARFVLSLCPVKKTMGELLRALETSAWIQDPGLQALGINCVDLDALIPAVADATAWFEAGPRPKTLGLELRPHLSGISKDGSWEIHACAPKTLVQKMRALLDSLPSSFRTRVALGTCCGGGPQHVQALRRAFAP